MYFLGGHGRGEINVSIYDIISCQPYVHWNELSKPDIPTVSNFRKTPRGETFAPDAAMVRWSMGLSCHDV